MKLPVLKFKCGCYGREMGVKARAFIRVAELRGARVDEADKNCPNHGRGSA